MVVGKRRRAGMVALVAAHRGLSTVVVEKASTAAPAHGQRRRSNN